MKNQQNQLLFEVADRTKTVGKILTNIWRDRRLALYEQDLYSESDIKMLVDASLHALQKGETMRIYFMSGELSKGYLINDQRYIPIPTTEYYSKNHEEGIWTYHDSMKNRDY